MSCAQHWREAQIVPHTTESMQMSESKNTVVRHKNTVSNLIFIMRLRRFQRTQNPEGQRTISEKSTYLKNRAFHIRKFRSTKRVKQWWHRGNSRQRLMKILTWIRIGGTSPSSASLTIDRQFFSLTKDLHGRSFKSTLLIKMKLIKIFN